MSEKEALMDPDASPGQPDKVNRGVRRINNRAMYIVLAVVMFFIVLIGLSAYDRSVAQQGGGEVPQAAQKEEGRKVHSGMNYAEAIAKGHQSGVIPAESNGVDPVITPPDVAKVYQPPEPPVNPSAARAAPPAPNQPEVSQADLILEEEKRQVRMMKMRQFQQALGADTSVEVAMPSQQAEGYPAGASGVQAVSHQAQPNGSGMGGMMNKVSGGSGYDQFASSGQGDRWQLKAQPEKPRSQFEVRAGFVIPAVMVSGINSDLPGQIVAQVSQNVYDTPTGHHLLVPQGSRLVGTYASDVAFGQSRVLVGWQRIIFPDGKAMDIGSMPGADSEGYSGFKDQVNNHYLRIFGGAIMMSAITASITLSQNEEGDNSSDKVTTSDAINEALGQQLGQVAAELVRKNMNVAPTLEIRPGYRFNVTLTKDLTFKTPYQSFDYAAGG